VLRKLNYHFFLHNTISEATFLEIEHHSDERLFKTKSKLVRGFVQRWPFSIGRCYEKGKNIAMKREK
jgi:hypothetical protein